MASVTLLGKSRLSIVQDVLTPDQCQDIINYFNNKEQTAARTQAYREQQPIDTKVRSGLVVLGDIKFPHYDTINDHVSQYLMLTGILVKGDPSSQFTVYSTPGDHFKSHVDDAADIHMDDMYFGRDRGQRKVSITIHLSPTSDYTGCKLQFPVIGDDHKWRSYDQTQGTMLIFPSFWRHRVTELHSGTRYSMVLWYHGKLWT